MGLTQEQWFKKIKGLVPAWFFEDEGLQAAHLRSLAKLLADIQTTSEGAILQTFIMSATEEDLDLHGSERGIERMGDEEDSAYAPRIQLLVNSSNKAAIKAMVDSILLVGTCEIREGFGPDNIYANRGSFIGRNEFLNFYDYNVFTIVIDKQLQEPLAFFSRGNYLSRGDYAGSEISATSIYDSIVSAVNKVKAYGVLYKIVERD